MWNRWSRILPMENLKKDALKKYYESLTEKERFVLDYLKKCILKEVPEAKETFSYGMPVFKFKNKYLMGINAAKKHYAIYPGSEPIEKLKKELIGYSTSKGTIRFTEENILKEDLLKKILNICIKRI